MPRSHLISVSFRSPYVGLRNVHNSCFVTSILQALFHTDAFLRALFGFRLTLSVVSSRMDQDSFSTNSNILKVLQMLFAHMSVTQHPHLGAEGLLDALPQTTFPPGQQQDASEVLRFLLNTALGGPSQGLVRAAFAGEMNEVTRCRSCGVEKRRPETFTELILPVPSEGHARSVQEILNEKLRIHSMDDGVACTACGMEKPGPHVWTEIVSPPRHLIVPLNRFDFDLAAGKIVKRKTPVKLSRILRLGEFTYECYMIIVHTGPSAEEGHYTCVGKRSESGEKRYWKIDDSKVLFIFK